MKKIITILLVCMMVASLTACIPKKINLPFEKTPETSVHSEPEKETKAPEKKPESKAAPVADADATVEATLWTLNYDPEVWTFGEDDLSDGESWSELIIIIPDGEDSYTTNVEIRANVDNPGAFRDYLVSYGFDEYEYAVNNAYEFTNIGGVDCLVQEGNYWGEPCLRYFNRVESAGVTVFIEIIGEYEDGRVDELLSGLTFNLEDIGNVDGPWYWEGEPCAFADASAMAGTITVNSQWLPITECLRTRETFNHAVAVWEDKVYILGDGALKEYTLDGTGLVYNTDIELDGDYETIKFTEDGTLWVSGFMEPLTCIKDGVVTASYDGPDTVTMHDSGTWGISWFSGPECEKITLSGGAIASEPMNFEEVSTISSVTIDDNYIFIGGYAADESGHKVFVYDFDGNLQYTLAGMDDEGLGSITFMAETSNGFLGMDGNMREIVLWTADGAYIGYIDASDIFGTYYPWFCHSVKMSDGSILTIMTEERMDESAMEVVAFKMTGF